MFRSALASTLLIFITVGLLPAQDSPRPGRLKSVDVENSRVTITSGEQEVTLEVTPQTLLKDATGRSLEQRLRAPDLKSGARILFKAEERDGKKVLAGLKLQEAAAQPAAAAAPPTFDSSKLRPLTELGSGDYQGHQGGLYPGGKNERPAPHEAAGLMLARQVRPLDAKGNPDPRGKIVLLSIGMSNTSQASEGFERALAGDSENPALVFVNGSVGGQTAFRIQNPNDNGTGTKYWAIVDERLQKAGLTRAQVEAVWIKQADAGPSQGFPAYAKTLEQELTRIVQVLHDRFPNLKLTYLTSRTYGGYALTKLNPEPYAYESGFSVRWLIERQLNGDPELNFDAKKGAVRAPWLSWGPYFWANGSTNRSDGFSYEPDDFVERDRTHLSQAGIDKVGRLMLDFFKTDATTRPWFVAK